jgi:hypothetical protein
MHYEFNTIDSSSNRRLVTHIAKNDFGSQSLQKAYIGSAARKSSQGIPVPYQSLGKPAA